MRRAMCQFGQEIGQIADRKSAKSRTGKAESRTEKAISRTIVQKTRISDILGRAYKPCKSCTAENEDVHLDEPLSPCRPVITSDDDSFTPALSALLQTDEVNAHDDSTAINLSDQRRPFTPFKNMKDTSYRDDTTEDISK